MNTERPPRAYSYIRFSTPEQAKGHSKQRQHDAARAWAEHHKVPLDNELTFEDKGVSGFTGANKETGALGVFLERVKDGTVPKGSWLLVESLDRISRQVARKAVRTIEDIVEAGVTVVDLSDGGREYSAETLDKDGMLFMMMVVRFIRANEESTLKGVRVAKAYANKRKDFASTEKLQKPYTRRLPAWIRWNDETKDYEPIEERAAILRQIFEFADQGRGRHWIATWLNDNKIETWGGGGWKAKYWHRSYVKKLLTNKAAIGVFVPHKMVEVEGKSKKQRAALDVIPHRFPEVVDKELFERVASRLSTTSARGRNARAPARSIFAGLMKCQYCSGTVTRVAKGQHVYLVCAAANAKATCRYESVPYQQAVDALSENIPHTIEQAPRGKDTGEIESEIEKQQVALSLADDAVDELLETVIADKSVAARTALRSAEQKQKEIEANLRSLRNRRDALTNTNVLARLAAVENALAQSASDIETINKTLRTAMRRMVMRPQDGTLDIYWHHADEPQEVTFVTSRKHWNTFEIENRKEDKNGEET